MSKGYKTIKVVFILTISLIHSPFIWSSFKRENPFWTVSEEVIKVLLIKRNPPIPPNCEVFGLTLTV